MIVSFLKGLWSFCSAVLLLALLLCAAEVGLRCRRVMQSCPATADVKTSETLAEAICRPSRTTFIESIPGKRLIRANPDTGQDIEIRLNDFGMRAIVPTIPKPDNTFRILVLGDETIFGSEVFTDELVTSRLESRLAAASTRPVEVLNAGIPGGCPLQAALWIRHSLLCLQPDLVIHHFDMSDVADDYAMRSFVLMGKDRSPRCAIHPGLVETRPDLAKSARHEFMVLQTAEEQLAEVWARRSSPRTRADLGDPLNRYRWLEDTPPDWTIPISHAIEALGDVRRSLPSTTAYVVVTCPKPWQVSENACASIEVRTAEGVRPQSVFASRRPFEMIEAYCLKQQLPFVACDDPFLAHREPETLYLNRSPGLSAEGHALYANSIAAFLMSRVPGPWGSSRAGSSGREVIEAQWTQPAGP